MAGICCIVEYRAGQYIDSHIDDFGFYLITIHSYPLLFVILNVASTKMCYFLKLSVYFCSTSLATTSTTLRLNVTEML